jgi:flagellar basal-body rod modification protein FlgD
MQIPGSMPAAQAATTDPSGSASQDTGTITANDFLTLLVTELKNQDPTANTDPNEYVNQLVQVNSLQQLIQINQNTTGATGSGSVTNP